VAAQIPIQNLYYLLCYAWGLPEQRDWVKVDADSCPAVLDLLSRLLTKGADILLKRGIAKEYRTHEEEIAGIKGKLELAKTIKANRHREGKTICTLDDLTGDILLNQIVYTTMYRLLGNKDLDKNVKKDLLRTFRRFPKVTLDNPKEGKRIILDAKYYQEMFVSRFGVNKNLRTDHIRQIESYVKNQEDPAIPYTLQTNGIMVYPKTDIDVTNKDYAFGDHILRFCTLDLGQDWRLIDQRLRQIIQF